MWKKTQKVLPSPDCILNFHYLVPIHGQFIEVNSGCRHWNGTYQPGWSSSLGQWKINYYRTFHFLVVVAAIARCTNQPHLCNIDTSDQFRISTESTTCCQKKNWRRIPLKENVQYEKHTKRKTEVGVAQLLCLISSVLLFERYNISNTIIIWSLNLNIFLKRGGLGRLLKRSGTSSWSGISTDS